MSVFSFSLTGLEEFGIIQKVYDEATYYKKECINLGGSQDSALRALTIEDFLGIISFLFIGEMRVAFSQSTNPAL